MRTPSDYVALLKRRLLAPRQTVAILRELVHSKLRSASPQSHAGQTSPPNSPFWHYNSTFEPIKVIEGFAVSEVTPSPDLVTNYLGVKIPTRVHPAALKPMAGTVEAAPIPANWHADIAEWGSALQAVETAGETFRMLELGCGWGCWMNITGVAARERGRKVRLLGVEGSADHVSMAQETLALNGFSENDAKVTHGIAAAEDGVALFPRSKGSAGEWGLAPILNPTDADLAKYKKSHESLKTHSLASLSEGETLDLLHIDIQGGEVDVVRRCIADMNKHVRSVLIGTHSRPIEGQLMEFLQEQGWVLEMERPAIFSLEGGEPLISVDGVQWWRNPAAP